MAPRLTMRPQPLRIMAGPSRLRQLKGRAEIGGDHRVPRRILQIEKWRSDEGAGRVDKDVDCTEPGADICRELARACAFGEIGLEHDGVVSLSFDLASEAFGARNVGPAMDRDAGAMSGKGARNAGARAGRGSRDEDDLAVEAVIRAHGSMRSDQTDTVFDLSRYLS